MAYQPPDTAPRDLNPQSWGEMITLHQRHASRINVAASELGEHDRLIMNHDRRIFINEQRIEGLMHLALGAVIISMTAVVLCMAIIVGLL